MNDKNYIKTEILEIINLNVSLKIKEILLNKLKVKYFNYLKRRIINEKNI